MDAPHEGRVSLVVNDETVFLRFDWRALSRLHGKFGAEWETEINRAIAEVDVAGLAILLGAGSERNPEWWIAASPPVVPTVAALRKALALSLWGPGMEPDEADPPPRPESRATNWWRRLFGRG